MFKRFFSFRGFALLLLLTSCMPEKGSEEYLPPEILSAEAVVNVTSVALSCTLSSPRVENCGVVYWETGGDKKSVEGLMSSGSFIASVTGLVPGMTYEWYAFIRAGNREIRTDVFRFNVDPQKPVVQGIDIPNSYFKRFLLERFDSDGDGELSEEEGLTIRKIDIITDKISSLKGIEYFLNLDSLICRGTSKGLYEYEGHPGLLDSLDVSRNKKLRYLACDGNMISKLDISGNPLLEELICNWNMLESIDFSGVSKLRRILVSNNLLIEIDLKNCTSVKELQCQGNQITMIDVSMLPHLSILDCSPMDDLDGKNMLLKLSISVGQTIQNVTTSRDNGFIPEETRILAETLNGSVEGYGGAEYDP